MEGGEHGPDLAGSGEVRQIGRVKASVAAIRGRETKSALVAPALDRGGMHAEELGRLAAGQRRPRFEARQGFPRDGFGFARIALRRSENDHN